MNEKLNKYSADLVALWNLHTRLDLLSEDIYTARTTDNASLSAELLAKIKTELAEVYQAAFNAAFLSTDERSRELQPLARLVLEAVAAALSFLSAPEAAAAAANKAFIDALIRGRNLIHFDGPWNK